MQGVLRLIGRLIPMKIKIVPRIISNKNRELTILAYTEIKNKDYLELINR